jgi:PBP1b-binding outer membrane lipoprotein LpoB
MRQLSKYLLSIGTALLFTSCGSTMVTSVTAVTDNTTNENTRNYASIIKPTLDSLLSAIKERGFENKEIEGSKTLFSKSLARNLSALADR